VNWLNTEYGVLKEPTVKRQTKPQPFDGHTKENLKEVRVSELHNYQRFFTDNGEGYCYLNGSCNDDYSLRPIAISQDSYVWVKND
jgi:hypothetical protein